MALAAGIGVEVSVPNVPNAAAIYFGEDQGRMLVTTIDMDAVAEAAGNAKIFSAPIGQTGGDAIAGPGFTVGLADLRAAHEGFFPKLMGSELTPEF
jgi:phosphoribosylformylglycinamidine synthase